jgi:bifunctional DNase/RNase
MTPSAVDIPGRCLTTASPNAAMTGAGSVDRLSEGTFYARIELVRQRTKRTVDARAGDAVALALLSGAPVLVTRPVFDQVS